MGEFERLLYEPVGWHGSHVAVQIRSKERRGLDTKTAIAFVVCVRYNFGQEVYGIFIAA